MSANTSNDWMLSEEQIADYKRDGYLVINDFLSEEEMQPLEEYFQAFTTGQYENMGRDFCDMSGPYSRDVEDFNLINAVLPRKYERALRDNVYERRAQHLAQQLIGSSATLDYDQFLSKKPNKPEALFAWHQDLGYWPTGTPDTVTTTFSLALDDADLDNGCLRVVPGSNREEEIRPHQPVFRSTSGLRDEAHVLEVKIEEQEEIAYLPVKRGGITIHDERIVHGSSGNSTDRWRRTYIVAFRSKACVDFERSIGFTHSHNDNINWQTHLDALGGESN